MKKTKGEEDDVQLDELETLDLDAVVELAEVRARLVQVVEQGAGAPDLWTGRQSVSRLGRGRERWGAP